MRFISKVVHDLRPHVPTSTLRDVVHVEAFFMAMNLFAQRYTYFQVVGMMLEEIPGLDKEKTLELLRIIRDAQHRWKDLVPGARHE